ncbi:hypothetical protein FS837_011940 [Tulasnella sp. UAMH 9824]|nr:hypothetical protein FS837_011940 [Tulasnella sp. UAMH 9824]
MGGTTAFTMIWTMDMPLDTSTATYLSEEQTANKSVGTRVTDVGGGEVDTSKAKHRNNLANPSLLWMVQQIKDAGLKIQWACNVFDDIPTLQLYFASLAGNEPGTSSDHSTSNDQEQVESNLPPEVLEELRKDIRGALHNRLSGPPSW